MASNLMNKMIQLGQEKMLPSEHPNKITRDYANKKDCRGTGFADLPREIHLVVLRNVLALYAAEEAARPTFLGDDTETTTEPVKSARGRTPYRNAWPLSPADYRTDEQVAIDGLATVSRQLRSDVLPLIMRRHVLKLAAWTPEFKGRCVDYVRSVSELFCQSVDWIWLEGKHWRLSCHLVGQGAGARGKTGWEDGRAREENVREFKSCETLEREAFVLRVDFVDGAREQALGCAEDMAELVERLLRAADARGRLGKAQLETLVAKTALTATEQRVGKAGVTALERVPNKFEFA